VLHSTSPGCRFVCCWVGRFIEALLCVFGAEEGVFWPVEVSFGFCLVGAGISFGGRGVFRLICWRPGIGLGSVVV